MSWSTADIPDMEGKVSVVTGANSGIGFHTAKELAGKNSRVILGCRNPRKAEEAKRKILEEHTDAEVECITLDLANKSQIKVFAAKFRQEYDRIDVLVNNAGVMHLPFKRTDFGFEYQFGVNYLGHFLLNSELIDLIKETEGSRVVSVSSLLHKNGELDFDKLNSEKGYDKRQAYADSKLAILVYAKELQRRFETKGIDSRSIAVHPGYVDTPLHDKAARHREGKVGSLTYRGITRTIAQSPRKGALPTLFAATESKVEGGEFIGSGGFKELRGPPEEVEGIEKTEDRDLAEELWRFSEKVMETDFFA